jgi:hypothetical protein
LHRSCLCKWNPCCFQPFLRKPTLTLHITNNHKKNKNMCPSSTSQVGPALDFPLITFGDHRSFSQMFPWHFIPLPKCLRRACIFSPINSTRKTKSFRSKHSFLGCLLLPCYAPSITFFYSRKVNQSIERFHLLLIAMDRKTTFPPNMPTSCSPNYPRRSTTPPSNTASSYLCLSSSHETRHVRTCWSAPALTKMTYHLRFWINHHTPRIRTHNWPNRNTYIPTCF